MTPEPSITHRSTVEGGEWGNLRRHGWHGWLEKVGLWNQPTDDTTQAYLDAAVRWISMYTIESAS